MYRCQHKPQITFNLHRVTKPTMIDTLVARTTKLVSQSHSRRRLATRSLLLQRQSSNINSMTSSSFTLFDSLSKSYKSVPLSITPNNQSLESKIHNSDDININSDNDIKGNDSQPYYLRIWQVQSLGKWCSNMRCNANGLKLLLFCIVCLVFFASNVLLRT